MIICHKRKMDQEKQKNRSGLTFVTSVSVSKEFQNYLDLYKLSPTECFRRGVAVMLFDMGIAQFNSPKNEKRSDYVDEFIKKIEKEEDLREQYEKIQLFEKLQAQLKNIKKTIQEIEE